MRLRAANDERDAISRLKAFFRDQQGATMVMGMFVAMLLVSMIYYVWGFGDAIIHRERMQDAADTAAFSGAVLHARGMNVIALLNAIMATLAMVAATMKTIVSMIQGAATAASLVCAGCGPWCVSCCAACPHAAAYWVEYSSADSVEDTVNSAVREGIRGTSIYARAIVHGIPVAAQAKVISMSDAYEPVTNEGLMAPPHRLSLPVQGDETNWACDKKVLPTVRLLAPIGVWAFWHSSIYAGVGLVYGTYRAKSHARDWCEDEFFQRIEDDAQTMGNGEYQVQAYMFGDLNYDWSVQGAGLATWGRGEDEGEELTDLARSGNISFAQAEFFYDDPESDWREWLWHMRWRARLRRWRLEDSGVGALTDLCGEPCSRLSGMSGDLNDLVVH